MLLAARGARDLGSGPEPQPPELVEATRREARRIWVVSVGVALGATGIATAL